MEIKVRIILIITRGTSVLTMEWESLRYCSLEIFSGFKSGKWKWNSLLTYLIPGLVGTTFIDNNFMNHISPFFFFVHLYFFVSDINRRFKQSNIDLSGRLCIGLHKWPDFQIFWLELIFLSLIELSLLLWWVCWWILVGSWRRSQL